MRLRSRKFSAVGAKNSCTDRHLSGFFAAESNGRCGHLHKVPVILILEHREGIRSGIIKYHRQVRQRSTGKRRGYQSCRIAPHREARFRKNRSRRCSRERSLDAQTVRQQ